MSRGEDKTNSLMSSCYSSRTIFHGGEENENERERKREMRQEYVVSSPHEFPWTRARSIGEEIEREREREKHKMVQKPLSRRGLLSFEPVGSSFEDYRTTEEASFP